MTFLKSFSDAILARGTPSDLLLVACTVGAIVTGTLAVTRQNKYPSAARFFGTLLVVCLALKANVAFVYAISVFIVATLITRLDFLENLAAIIWGRKEVWDYRKATKEEIETKEEERTVHPSTTRGRLLENALSPTEVARLAEPKLFKALEDARLYSKIDREMALVSASGRKFFLDAIGRRPDADYIIEVKAGSNPRLIVSGIVDLNRYIAAFKQAALAYADVRGLLICITSDDIIEIPWESVAVVKFNPKTNEIEKLAALRQWMGLAG